MTTYILVTRPIGKNEAEWVAVSSNYDKVSADRHALIDAGSFETKIHKIVDGVLFPTAVDPHQ